MAIGTNHETVTTKAVFIPEVWSDNVIGTYKQELVLANLITKMNHKGKKGDTIHIPKFTRGSATAKTAETAVSFNTATEGEVQVLLDKHYYWAKAIEDIVSVQALPSLRARYTGAAGEALAEQVDSDLHALGATFQGGTAYSGAVIGDGTTAWDGSANTNTGNGSRLSDAGIRNMIQTLDDANVPTSNRFLVIPPVERNSLLGLARFTEQAYNSGSDAIQTGRFGMIYGMDVYVSTNCATKTK